MKKIKIIPAVDLLEGKCVRLFKGDYRKSTVFDDNPVNVAMQFVNDGAKFLHIIDLDGAKNGGLKNINIVKQIIETVPLEIKIQYGGGIRGREDIYSLLGMGLDQVILSSVVVENLSLLENFGNEFGFENITIAVDVRDGFLTSHGWLKETKIEAEKFISEIIKLGIIRIIYTDVEKDGTLTSPNFTDIQKIRNITKDIDMIVAGGIRNKEDIGRLDSIKVDGVVLGSSLYKKNINLNEIC